MDATQVIRHVRTFITEVIPKAYCCSNWTEESITSAFKWAGFCEQVYEAFCNCDTTCLDIAISDVSKSVNRKDIACLEDLKNSTVILIKAFNFNPCLKNEDLQKLCDSIIANKTNENPDHMLELSLMCRELVEALKPLTSNLEASVYYEVKAEIFLEHLWLSVGQMTTGEEMEKFLTSTLEALCHSEEDMMLFLHLPLIDTENNCTKINEIQEFCMTWMLLKILDKSHNALAPLLWKLSSSKLCKLASKYSTFFIYYIDHLEQKANSLKCDENNTWGKEFSTSDLTFSDIIHHFKALLQCNTDVSKTTKNLIVSKSCNQYSVWKEIYTKLFD